MAREPKAGKSETLTIRLDPKTRFVLEYLSRLKGQTITTVVERAIVNAASNESVQTEGGYANWQYFWDVSDGVRALKMAENSAFFPTYEEEKRLAFAREHWPFFYQTIARDQFVNHYIDVLWPRIDEFVQMHEDMRARNYFAAGEAMAKALSTANLEPPKWVDAIGHPNVPQAEIPF
jgi:hypothetical protein